MADEMGYQKKLYVGTAGSAAATQVLQATDVDYNVDYDFGNTTIRGAGTSVPIETENPTVRKARVSWKMIDDPSDSVLITLIAASKNGTAIACKITDSGATLFDGDIYIPKQCAFPLRGESTYSFEGHPTKSAARSPTIG